MSHIRRIQPTDSWTYEPYGEGDIHDDRKDALQADHGIFDGEQSGTSGVYAGVWRTQPCTLRVRQESDELCVILEGSATLTDLDSGQQETFAAGDSFLLVHGFNLEWDIHTDLMKTYMIVKPLDQVA